MMGQSEQVGEELRLLLTAAIAVVEPMLGQLNPPDAPASSCTWCPVCALAALSRGEQHPLLAAISVHGAALLAMLSDYLAKAAADHAGGDAGEGQSTADQTPASEPAGESPQPGPAARRPSFQRIDITMGGAAVNAVDGHAVDGNGVAGSGADPHGSGR